MALKRCDQGHYYDGGEHTSCPHCGIPDLRAGQTIPKRSVAPDAADGPAGATVAARPAGFETTDAGARASTLGRGQRGERGETDGKTIGIFQRTLGVDPVVGWLVCVEGPDRGRDYRIRSGRNFLGRDESMHIAIRNDPGISRVKHAILSYEPRKGQFKLLPGDSAGLAYVNGDTVDMPVALAPFDTIELGETKLMFVPFCGERFQWPTETEGGA